MSRLFVLQVIFCRRDEDGEPVIEGEAKPDEAEAGYLRALRRGLPHEMALKVSGAWGRGKTKRKEG